MEDAPGVLPGHEADGVGGDPEAVGWDLDLQADGLAVVVPPGAGAGAVPDAGAQGGVLQAVGFPGDVGGGAEVGAFGGKGARFHHVAGAVDLR